MAFRNNAVEPSGLVTRTSQDRDPLGPFPGTSKATTSFVLSTQATLVTDGEGPLPFSMDTAAPGKKPWPLTVMLAALPRAKVDGETDEMTKLVVPELIVTVIVAWPVSPVLSTAEAVMECVPTLSPEEVTEAPTP